MKNNFLDLDRVLTTSIVLVIVVLLLGICWCFYVVWQVPPSEFATFFSGTVSPILSFITILVLLFQVEHERKSKRVETDLRRYDIYKIALLNKVDNLKAVEPFRWGKDLGSPPIVYKGQSAIMFLTKKSHSFFEVRMPNTSNYDNLMSILKVLNSIESLIDSSNEKEIFNELVDVDFSSIITLLKGLSSAISDVNTTDESTKKLLLAFNNSKLLKQ